MGFQQYLLLVLASIIVGGAIVLGINQFNENAREADADALLQDALNIAAKVQSWRARGDLLGGGNNSFNNLSLEKLGVPTKNNNGEFTLEVLAGDEVKITGRGVAGNRVEVTVSPRGIQSTTFSDGGEKSGGVESGSVAANSIEDTEVDAPNGLAKTKADSVHLRESLQHSALNPKKRKNHYDLGAGCAMVERN